LCYRPLQPKEISCIENKKERIEAFLNFPSLSKSTIFVGVPDTLGMNNEHDPKEKY
jgi:hypothetical protein